MQATTLNHPEGIAIVGMTGRFPGAKNIEEFWQNLQNQVESITSFTDEELLAAGVNPAWLNHPNYIKAGAALTEDIGLFDATFFGYSPREAEIIDPQHRLFLESTWEAIETAGYNPETYPGRIGVYAGVGRNTYLLFNLFSHPDLIESVGAFQTLISNDKDFLSTRVSYRLNLKGPSITVQTACSTSLVAVHLACQSLLNGESDLAIAGGVSLKVPHPTGYFYQAGGIYSPDGHCRSFDAKAQGTVGGSGIGIVVLKRLEEAIADGDCIHAVIKGSAINNDGAVKVGYTAPSVEGQAEVIAEALAIAGVEPETIGYVETHGTATPLGDPIEIAALTKAFRSSTQQKGFCAIGSVKSNVGHLDAAAGVTGLIKTVLALKHQLIPPSLHFQQPNPEIDFANSPFYVNTTLCAKTDKTLQRAGVSSFGIGGTNAHVIVEAAPPTAPTSASRPWQLLVLSAKTASALETATTNLLNHLKQHPDLNLADVAYTLQVGRKAFHHRRILTCQTLDQAIVQLEQTPLPDSHSQELGDRSIVFLFPGQGAQYQQMGWELYQTEPIFRNCVDRCAEVLQPLLNLDLREILYSKAQAEALNQTSITQPALFVIEYALAQLWMSWGIQPQAMSGHSIGEYVAACLAGVFSWEAALEIVATRGRLMQQLPSGAMLSVALSAAEIQPLLSPQLALAAVNAPDLSVVSGTETAIAQLHSHLTQQGITCRRLQTSHAFHSEMMHPILAEFTQHVAKFHLQPPKIPFISNVTGTWITPDAATNPDYWAKHLRQTVRFADGVVELLKQPQQIFLEVGPGRTLSTLVKQRSPDAVVVTSMRHPQESQSDLGYLLKAIGQLWLYKVPINWSRLYTDERRQTIPLPTYPFERQRYWIDPPHSTTPSTGQLLTKKSNITDWFYIPTWKQSRLFANQQQVQANQCWLIFEDECGIGKQLIQKLEVAGQKAIAVRMGEQFTQLSDDVYAINPRQLEDYNSLIQQLQPQRIIHLWGVTSNPAISSEFVQPTLELGFYTLLYLAQALGKQDITDTLPLIVIANHLYDITGAEMLSPAKMTMLGPCKVIPQEYPYLTCRLIDIDLTASVPIELLLAEMTAQSAEPVVAYRGYHRWVQAFDPVSLDTVSVPTQLREQGIYLITGGLGGIGLVLAEYLAKTVRAKLILVARSALPEQQHWEKWLSTHDAQDKISGKIQQIQALEQLGAEVLVKSADVTDLAQMQTVINQAVERFGTIHGVLHTAGIAGGGMMQLKTPETTAAVLAAKVQGTLVLDTLLQNQALDFWLLGSSLSAIAGGFGQVDYCAANAFLDGFAHYKTSRRQQYTISINWDTWQQVGMAVNTVVPEELKQRRQASLKRGIAPLEGAEAFSRILAAGVPQVIVATTDLATLLEQYYAAQSWEEKLARLEAELKPESFSNTTHPRPELGTPYIAPRNSIEQSVAEIWQQLLGIEQIGIHDDFFELGGHSLLATQVIARLRSVFQQELPLNRLFETPTVAGLAAIIEPSQQQSNSDRSLIIQPTQQDCSKQLLAELNQLSEQEIDALLSNMLTEPESRRY